MVKYQLSRAKAADIRIRCMPHLYGHMTVPGKKNNNNKGETFISQKVASGLRSPDANMHVRIVFLSVELL